MSRCPIKYVTPESWAMVEAYRYFKMFGMPNPDGWLNQPSKFLEAMDIIDQMVIELAEEKNGKH